MSLSRRLRRSMVIGFGAILLIALMIAIPIVIELSKHRQGARDRDNAAAALVRAAPAKWRETVVALPSDTISLDADHPTDNKLTTRIPLSPPAAIRDQVKAATGLTPFDDFFISTILGRMHGQWKADTHGVGIPGLKVSLKVPVAGKLSHEWKTEVKQDLDMPLAPNRRHVAGRILIHDVDNNRVLTICFDETIRIGPRDDRLRVELIDADVIWSEPTVEVQNR